MKFSLSMTAGLVCLGLSQAARADILAGWEQWASGNEAATKTSHDASGQGDEAGGDWRENVAAQSNDGTFGTVTGANNTLTGNLTGTFIGTTQTEGSYDFIITAGASALALDGFHFDARRKRSNSATTWTVSVTAGDITIGQLGTGGLGGALGGVGPADHNDYDIDLTTLADNILEPGQSATFRLAFTGGTYSNNDQHTYLDNVAITGGLATNPLDPADLDLDGDVDDADFGIAFAAFTGPGGVSESPADLDNDGDVDDADFGIAFAAFTGPGGGAAVPEPASLALMALGGLLVARRRRA